MAAAIQVASSINKRDQLTIAGTGFAVTHAATIDVTGPAFDGTTIHEDLTTSGAGAVTSGLKLTFNKPGIVKVVVSDGTDTLTQDVEVFDS